MNKKLVILMSSIPGAGKTTIARRLMVGFNVATKQCKMVSSDDYPGYYNEKYEYSWSQDKCIAAGKYCREAFVKALEDGCQVVIVDNTNLSVRARTFYLDKAKEMGYDTMVLAILPDRNKIRTYAKRNVHNVGEALISEMIDTFYLNMDI